jgi:hypothetical protein
MLNGPDDGDGLALSLFDANAYFGMRDQTVGFEDFGDLLFGLDFRQSGNMQANRHERDTDRAGLADADFTAKLFYIEDFEVQQIAIANDVIVLHRARGRRQRAYAVVDLLWRLKNGLLSAAGWGQDQ